MSLCWSKARAGHVPLMNDRCLWVPVRRSRVNGECGLTRGGAFFLLLGLPLMEDHSNLDATFFNFRCLIVDQLQSLLWKKGRY